MHMEFSIGMSLIFLLFSQSSESAETAVFPQANNDVLVNPHMGWVMEERLRDEEVKMGTVTPVDGDWEKVRTIMLRSGWALMNPEENVYDWDLFDEAYEYWSGEGKDISLRIVTDGNIMQTYRGGCPQWVYDKGVDYTEWLANGITTRVAKTRNATYQTELVKFQEAFINHLQTNGWLNSVVQIDLRGYGLFGEWHTGYDYTSLSGRLDGLYNTIDNWIDPFIDAGWNGFFYLSDSYEWNTDMALPLSIDLATPPSYEEYLENSAFDYAFQNPFIAPRRDGFGQHIETEYDGRHMLELWRATRKPLHAEVGKDFSVYEDGDIYGMDPQALLDQMVTYHCNFVDGWVLLKRPDFYNDEQGWVNEALRQMGYRLVPAMVKYPQTIKQGEQWYVRHTWQNSAGGRLFVPYNVKFYLMTGNTVAWSFHDRNSDLVTMVQGENPEIVSYFPCPAESCLSNGIYDLRVAIVDTNGTPCVQMPLPDGDSMNRYKIGTITVNSSVAAPSLPGKTGFEAGTVDGTGFALSALSSVSSSPNAISGTYSVFADVPLTNSWNTVLRTTNTLESGATYKISFKYYLIDQPGGSLDDPGYMEFTARSPSSGTAADRGRTCWMDEAGLAPAVKTVYVTLGDHSDYRFQWSMHWGGKMALDDIRIEKMATNEAFYSQNFETGQFSSECWPFSNSGISTANALEGTYAVSGSATYDPSTLSPHWTALLGCQPGFETNSTYTLSFSYEQLESADWGGYNYVTLKTPTGGSTEEVRLLRWIELAGDEVRKTVTFTTGSRNDYRLIWGLRNGGSAVVDDITIIKDN